MLHGLSIIIPMESKEFVAKNDSDKWIEEEFNKVSRTDSKKYY